MQFARESDESRIMTVVRYLLKMIGGVCVSLAGVFTMLAITSGDGLPFAFAAIIMAAHASLMFLLSRGAR